MSPHRWMVNYLRHARTRYDTVLDSLYRWVGYAVAAEVIRDHVLAAIAPEARRQSVQR